MDKQEEKFAAFLDEDSQIFDFSGLANPTNCSQGILIRLEALEMLEAEFHNQRLLPLIGHSQQTNKALLYVSKQAALESSYWRWRARRIGLKTTSCVFVVKIPAYLSKLALELLSSTPSINERKASDTIFLDKVLNSINPANDYKTIQSKLDYLEKFAELVSGKQHLTATNRYQRGLELILQVLSSNANLSSANQENQLQISLPISREEFQKQVKDYLTQSR